MSRRTSPRLGAVSSTLFNCLSPGKAFIPKQKPVETQQENVTTLDPELEEALSSATDTELCDLACKLHYRTYLLACICHRTKTPTESASKSTATHTPIDTCNSYLILCCTSPNHTTFSTSSPRMPSKYTFILGYMSVHVESHMPSFVCSNLGCSHACNQQSDV